MFKLFLLTLLWRDRAGTCRRTCIQCPCQAALHTLHCALSDCALFRSTLLFSVSRVWYYFLTSSTFTEGPIYLREIFLFVFSLKPGFCTLLLCPMWCYTAPPEIFPNHGAVLMNVAWINDCDLLLVSWTLHCLLYYACCVRNTPNFVTLSTKHSLSHSFCGSESRHSLVGFFWLKVFDLITFKLAVLGRQGPQSNPKTQCGNGFCCQTSVVVGRSQSGSTWASLPGCLTMWHSGLKAKYFCSLILEMMSNHLFHILFIWSKSVCPTHTQGEEITQGCDTGKCGYHEGAVLEITYHKLTITK